MWCPDLTVFRCKATLMEVMKMAMKMVKKLIERKIMKMKMKMILMIATLDLQVYV